jgi:sucrose-6-phosphate hydrolase SacC (GH32 family)
MRGGTYPGMPFNQQMSFPCEMHLRPTADGLRLFRTPVREIERLYGRTHTWTNLALKPGENPLATIRGDLFDITAELDVGGASRVGLTIRGEPLRYDARDRTLTCLGKSAALEPANGRLRLRILVDRTSIELLATRPPGQQCQSRP